MLSIWLLPFLSPSHNRDPREPLSHLRNHCWPATSVVRRGTLSGTAAPHHQIPRALTVIKRAIGRGVFPPTLKRGGQHHNHPTPGVFRVPPPGPKSRSTAHVGGNLLSGARTRLSSRSGAPGCGWLKVPGVQSTGPYVPHKTGGAPGNPGCGRGYYNLSNWHRGYLFSPDLLLWSHLPFLNPPNRDGDRLSRTQTLFSLPDSSLLNSHNRLPT